MILGFFGHLGWVWCHFCIEAALRMLEAWVFLSSRKPPAVPPPPKRSLEAEVAAGVVQWLDVFGCFLGGFYYFD